MHREEEAILEIIERWRKNERRAFFKFVIWSSLGYAAVMAGIFFGCRYLSEHSRKPSICCTMRTYNGHDYLFLSSGNIGEKGVVHDPDCGCHKKAENRQSPANIKNTDGKRYLLLPTVKETVPEG